MHPQCAAMWAALLPRSRRYRSTAPPAHAGAAAPLPPPLPAPAAAVLAAAARLRPAAQPSAAAGPAAACRRCRQAHVRRRACHVVPTAGAAHSASQKVEEVEKSVNRLTKSMNSQAWLGGILMLCVVHGWRGAAAAIPPPPPAAAHVAGRTHPRCKGLAVGVRKQKPAAQQHDERE